MKTLLQLIWGESGENYLRLDDTLSLIEDPQHPSIPFIKRMLEQENYLLALQAIADIVDPGGYANHLRRAYSRPNYVGSVIHEYIKQLDSKIVITTNFDKITKIMCNEHGYTTATYQETQKILTNIKSTENLIIKAHGTIEDVDSMVFTQKQYYEAKKNNPHFYEILKSLFMTNTVLFLGYSLNDPDINLILEAVANSGSPSSPHYVAVKQGTDGEIKKYWRECYNIYTLEYGPGYENLEENIESLLAEVVGYREFKRLP